MGQVAANLITALRRGDVAIIVAVHLCSASNADAIGGTLEVGPIGIDPAIPAPNDAILVCLCLLGLVGCPSLFTAGSPIRNMEFLMILRARAGAFVVVVDDEGGFA